MMRPENRKQNHRVSDKRLNLEFDIDDELSAQGMAELLNERGENEISFSLFHCVAFLN